VNHRLAAFVAVLLLISAPRAQQPPERFEQWLAAVKAHEPGNPGKAAIDIAVWTGVELDRVVTLAKQHARSLPGSRRDEANDVLLRGAALHADIARLIPDEMVRRSPKQDAIFVVRDGREHGRRYMSIHWGLGRSLLDAVAPEPAAHPGVRRWYQDTSNDLLRLRSLSEAAVHLPRARHLFPSDSALLFLSGILHERFASPSLQAAATAITGDARGTPAVSSARTELSRAERFFRDTLALQPNHLEARIRHGRVLGLLGRHSQAAEALRGAIRSSATGEFLYMAELFLGSEEEALGHSAAARAAFERAAVLYPRAQSPRLALSQLARRAGDRAGAQRQLRILAELPEDEAQREDPWWNYYDVR
jgi:tetratricopeptide (TPR) repeat protein